MNLNFDDASAGSAKKYLEPGVHTVRTKSITSDVSPSGSPYIEWIVEGETGLTCAHRFFINTVLGEGKEKTAWDVSKNEIFKIVKAALNLDDTEAKAKMPRFQNSTELESKLASELTKLVTGKSFDILLNGQEIKGNDGKQNWTKAVFGRGYFAAPAKSGKLKFDESRHVKRLPSETSETAIGNKSDW